MLCISPAEAESLHTHVRPEPALLHDEFDIDTNIVSYLFDSELWARESASLMRARAEMIVAYRQAGKNLEAGTNFTSPSVEVGLSVVRYKASSIVKFS